MSLHNEVVTSGGLYWPILHNEVVTSGGLHWPILHITAFSSNCLICPSDRFDYSCKVMREKHNLQAFSINKF